MRTTAKAMLDIVLNLTRLRDRDALELGLAAGLYGLVRPQRLSGWRVVEQQGEKHLAQCLQFDEESQLHVPEIQLDMDQMQPLQHWPAAWREVCESGLPQCIGDGQDDTLLLPVCLPQPILLIQLHGVAAATQQAIPELQGLLQVYANHLRMLDYAEKTRSPACLTARRLKPTSTSCWHWNRFPTKRTSVSISANAMMALLCGWQKSTSIFSSRSTIALVICMATKCCCYCQAYSSASCGCRTIFTALAVRSLWWCSAPPRMTMRNRFSSACDKRCKRMSFHRWAR